ncbi:MAG: peptidoglycan DD-metalloendopeptidase family protein [Mariprofundaceae bacterium]|nr:peptidoglycan DD-metalloendopeptidase family protein [Mariprofundaceae bacterium]
MVRLFLLALLIGLVTVSEADAGQNARTELEQIKKERQSLVQIRQQLESKLGLLGKELRQLDGALVTARSAYREVSGKITEVDRKLLELHRKKVALKADIKRQEAKMLKQSVAAYQRVNRQPGWLDAFAGVSASEIPHRKMMLQFALHSQERERQAWQSKIVKLAAVEKMEVVKRDELAVLQQERAKRQSQVASRVAEKHKMAERVRRDVGLNKQREAQLIAQEKALQRLIAGLGEGLLSSDRAADSLPVRKLKGKLPWPLKGKIVARFNSLPVVGRPRLTGVQMAPRSHAGKGRQVKAIGSGQVRYSDWFGGYGLMMIVDHGDGLISVYAHNDALYLQMGEWVEEGEALAEAGSTGWIEDVRLYFEVRDKGKPVNPADWCRK